jgi:predicted Zn finger-like uncharacterized protein
VKFVCDNCSTQYMISDDKISGKGVKVRCKRCGHVIVLRPEEGAEALASRPTDPRGEPLAHSRAGGDEVGQAFDQLLQGGGVGESEEDGDGEGQATEVFRMEGVARSKRPADSIRSRLDEVFDGKDSSEVASRPEETGKADWYLAIGEEQVGPLGMREVEARWASGEIVQRSLAWKTGMPEWKAIREIEALRHLWDQSRAAEEAAPLERDRTDVSSPGVAQAPPEEPVADLWAPNRRSELASLVEEEMDAVKASPAREGAAQTPGGGSGLPADLSDGADEEVPPWERDDSVVSGQVARPSDSYFDSSLDARPDGAAGGGPLAYSRSGSVLAGPAYLGGGRKSSARLKLIAGAAGAGLLLVVAAGAFFLFRPEPATPTGEEGPLGPGGPLERPRPGEPGRSAGEGGAGAERPEKPGEGGEPASARGGEPAGPTVEEPPVKEPDGASPEMVVRRPGEAPATTPPSVPRTGPGAIKKPPVVAKPLPKPPPTRSDVPPPPKNPKTDKDEGASTPAGDVPQQLSQSDISNALKKYVPAMKGCVQQQQQRDPTVTGTMVVTFTVAPSGKVSSFEVTTKEHEGTYVASCISFIVKAIKFPQAREPFTVPRLPLKLGG